MKKYLILFLLLFYNSAFSEIVKNRNYRNERISDETIKVYGNISINSDYGNNEINQILKIFTQQIF